MPHWVTSADWAQVWHVPCGGFTYGDDNLVFIANDWHTSLLPVYLQVRGSCGTAVLRHCGTAALRCCGSCGTRPGERHRERDSH